MEGRESKGPPPAPSADLFVCFPSRVSHLSLIPKPICSPARSSEPNNRHLLLHRYYHLKRSSNRGVGAGQASPLLWAKTKSMSKEIDEPTSPRVNCAGKIKVRTTKESSSSSCKKWESSAAMEEMEKLHRNRKLHKKKKKKKKKKNAMQEFFPCLTRIRMFHFRCFGSFSAAELPSDDEDAAADDHEDGDYGENQLVQSGRCGSQIAKINVGTVEGSDDDGNNEISRTVFSKWFMVLQEDLQRDKSQEEELVVVPPPPPNALLLMRCRSAPAKSRLEVRSDQEEKEGAANDKDKHDQEERDVEEKDEKEEEEKEKEKEGEEEEEEKKGKLGMDEEERRGKRLGVVMRYDIDLCKFSSNFAKETWVVGDVRNPLPKSRSWRR